MVSASTAAATFKSVAFNLMDDPWIPVSGLDGRQGLYSIRRVLADGHLLSGWFSGETLFGAAAARLLVAVLWRAHPLLNTATAADLVAARDAAAAQGRCDVSAVDAYCDRWRDKFWLVEPPGSMLERFGQDTRLGMFLQDRPESRLIKPVTVTKLSMHASPAYLWSNEHAGPLTFDAAARHLLMFLHYAPGGRPDGVHPDEGNPKAPWQAARLRNTVSVHPCGKNLYETLLAHVAAPEEALSRIGVPEWERGTEYLVSDPLGPPSTLLGQLTGRFTHCAWLLVGEDGLVDRAAATTGRRRGADVIERDPFTVRYWQRSGTGDDAEETLRPLRAVRGRSVWRDIDNLFVRSKAHQNDSHAYGDTPVVASAPSWTARWVFASHRCVQAKEVAWSESTLPAAALLAPEVWRNCSAFVAEAEQTADQLTRQVAVFARRAGVDAASLRDRALDHYWSTTERRFAASVTADSVDAMIELPAKDARLAFDAAVATVGARLCRGARDVSETAPTAAVAAVCRTRIIGPAARAEREARKTAKKSKAAKKSRGRKPANTKTRVPAPQETR